MCCQKFLGAFIETLDENSSSPCLTSATRDDQTCASFSCPQRAEKDAIESSKFSCLPCSMSDRSSSGVREQVKNAIQIFCIETLTSSPSYDSRRRFEGASSLTPCSLLAFPIYLLLGELAGFCRLCLLRPAMRVSRRSGHWRTNLWLPLWADVPQQSKGVQLPEKGNSRTGLPMCESGDRLD
jgi:hypothetical protein